jgi:drug/metabolite transporter (DMT)-like permease
VADPVIAVVVTLIAALAFAASSVMEQRATHQVPDRGVSPRLLQDLSRRRRWRIALLVQILGNILQIVALHFGPLALVQPLLVSNLLFAVLIAVAARHRPPDRIILAGVLASAAGIAVFIVIARPSRGSGTVSFGSALPLLAALGAVIAGCLLAARASPRAVRSLWLALACGADFGVNAFLLKLVPDTLPLGFADPLAQWPLYAAVVIGPLGFLLNQSAFQAGTLISPVLAIITTVDPLVSIGIAHVWLDEKVASSPADLVAEALALAVMTGGIFLLAHRAPRAAPKQAEAAARGPARPAGDTPAAAPGEERHSA